MSWPCAIDMDRIKFIASYGGGAAAADLAHVLGMSIEDVRAARSAGCRRRDGQAPGFAELFTLFHGRAPEDSDWPPPLKIRPGHYRWDQPELTLLATLVGELSYDDIAQVLTERLRKITGDPAAVRNKQGVILAANRMGLVSTDVIGGITVAVAGREIGSVEAVRTAVAAKRLAMRRVGRLLVIPHAEWERWKATIVHPPEGYVQLSTLRAQLGISSDAKLPEFAKLGYIPTAIRCNPYGTQAGTTQFGTWYVDAVVAKQLLADRKSGRAMPWHGKALPDNLKVTFRKWQERQHPAHCQVCQSIWGNLGAPRSFEDFCERYPPLQHGQKRHLTMVFRQGLTLAEAATATGASVHLVRRAIANGMMRADVVGRTAYLSKTEVTRWKARRCPTGTSSKSFISIATALADYGFTAAELQRAIQSGRIQGKLETNGPGRGQAYVVRQQCALYREEVGFTEAQAIARVGVSRERFRELLAGVDWRVKKGAAARIPLATVQAVIKRNASARGYTIEQAAIALAKTEEWVRGHIAAGTVRVARASWDARRLYLTAPMFRRLQAAAKTGAVPAPPKPASDLMTGGQAAMYAGVSTTTLLRWVDEARLPRHHLGASWGYRTSEVRRVAARYWDSRLAGRSRLRAPEWYVKGVE